MVNAGKKISHTEYLSVSMIYLYDSRKLSNSGLWSLKRRKQKGFQKQLSGTCKKKKKQTRNKSLSSKQAFMEKKITSYILYHSKQTNFFK